MSWRWKILSRTVMLAALLVFAPAAVIAQATGEPEVPPAADEQGEKLPAGAIVRVGRAPEGERTYGGIYHVLFTPDGQRLVTRNLQQTIRVWDTATGKELHALEAHEDRVKGLAISPDGFFLVSAAPDPREEVHLWNLESGESVRSIPGGGRLAKFLPDETTLMIVSETGIAHYDLATGAPLGEYPEVRIPLALSPDGKQLAAIRRLDADRIILIETTTGKEKLHLTGLTANPAAVAFSPDGTVLAVAGRDEEQVRIWNIAQQKVVLTLAGHAGERKKGAIDVAFSPDGRFIATGGWDYKLRLFEVASGELITALEGHAGNVTAVGFSPGGRLLASGSSGRDDASALVWRVRDCIAAPSVPPEEINDPALVQAWTDLGSEKPPVGFAAAGTLAAASQAGLEFIKTQLKELKPAPIDQIEKLIAQLDADDFGTRERATEELTRLRAVADTLLRKKLAETDSPEVRFRIKQILAAKTPESKLTPEAWRRMRRLVYSLELLADPLAKTAKPAREFLSLMSIGHPDVKVMREAAAALERLPDNS